MSPFHCRLVSRVIITAALMLGASAANAQTLKSGTLSLVVPFASGGPSDVTGRILAQGLQDALGQPVVVENPVGAGGTVGSLRVSRGTPDGSAFVLGNTGTHSWSQSLYRRRPTTRSRTSHRSALRSSRRASSSCRRICRPTRCRSSSPT